MKKRSVLVWVIGFCLIASAANAASTLDPTDIGIGARAIGMGRAFSAVSNDTNAVFMNPAGLMQLKSAGLTSMYSNLLDDIKYTVLGVSAPAKVGGFGIGFVNGSTGDVPLTTLDAYGRAVPLAGVLGYSSSVITISYGAPKGAILPKAKFLSDIAFGVNAKLFSQGFSGVNGQNAFGMDFDLGMLYQPKKYFSASLLAKNILPSGGGTLGTLVWTSGTKENIPSLLKAGLALKLFGKDAPAKIGGTELLFATDLDLDIVAKKPSLIHMGIEWLPVDYLSIRAGLDQDYAVGATSTGLSDNMTLGVGLKLGNVAFDYAYRNYRALSENTTHYFSISLVDLFTKTKDKKAAPSVVAEKKKEKTKEVRSDKAIIMSEIKDVPAAYWASGAIEYNLNMKFMTVNSYGYFEPERAITRAELAAMLVKSKYPSLPPAGIRPRSFKDVPDIFWAKKYIGVAADLNLMEGYPDGTFRPNSSVTLILAINSFEKYGNIAIPTKVTKPVYSNLPASSDIAPAVKAAKDAGLLYFVKDKFDPDVNLTRSQAAWMLYKVQGKK